MESGRLSFHVQDSLYPFHIDGFYSSFHECSPKLSDSYRVVCLVGKETKVLGPRSLSHYRGYLLLDGRFINHSCFSQPDLPF